MDKLDQLKSTAKMAAEQRGHRMRKFTHIHPGRAYSTCKACDRRVDVIVQPMPNETHISGEAVALGCK